MATKAECQDYIARVAPCAKNAFQRYGKVRPSVAIAMAALESGWGASGLAKNHNNHLGIKKGTLATKEWGGRTCNMSTKEEYTPGVQTTVKADFRAYDDMQQCLYNYYELLNTSYYEKVKAGASSTEQLEQIKECGYMTSSTEVTTCKSIIKQWDLEQYDVVEEDDEIVKWVKQKRGEPLWELLKLLKSLVP